MNWLRDPEDGAKRAYREEIREQRMGSRVRTAATVIGVINTVFIGLDYYAFHERFADFVWVRFALNAALAVSYVRLSRTNPVVGQATVCLATGAMLLMVIYGTSAPTSDYYVGLILLVIGTPVVLPLRAVESAAFSGLLLVAFAVAPLVLGGPAAPGLDATAAWQSYTVHCFFLAGATLVGIASSYTLDRARFRDFLQRRDLERARDDLRELDRIKSRFTANVHHELRTPLTLTLTPLEAILSGEFGKVPEVIVGYLKTMHVNGLRLLKLINDLLDLAKVEGQQLELRRREVDVRQIVNDIVIGARLLAERKNIEFTTAFEAGLPTMYVDADALEKVLVNLVGNALKFTDAGGRIEVGVTPHPGGIQLAVVDSGIGLAPDQLERVFDRFAQVDASATRKHEGTGIGLSLVKELAELHGGRVWAESEGLGHGTRMNVFLPVGSADEPEAEEFVLQDESGQGVSPRRSLDALAAEIDVSSEESDEYRLAEIERNVCRWEDSGGEAELDAAVSSTTHPYAPEIVVAEDNSEMRRLLGALLGRECRVRLMRDGLEALEAVRQSPPDLVLTDVMMPGMSGTELCRVLKRDPKTRDIPVVLVTSKAEREMKIEGLELGADDYVTKPFHPRELLARVRALVRVRVLQKELSARNARLESTLAELQATEVQLVHSERLAAVGELAAGVAHEVNNPVNFAINSLQTMRDRIGEMRRLVEVVAEIDPSSPEIIGERLQKLAQLEEGGGFAELMPEIEELLAIATHGLERTHCLVGDLQNFSGRGPILRTPIDVRDCLALTIRLVGPTAQDAGVTIECEFADDIPIIESSTSVLNQTFLNLLKNAIDALEDRGGTIRASVRLDTADAEIVVVIADDGLGIDPKIRSRLFDPFVSTKTAGKGAGLGLSICRCILGDLGGKIELLATGEPGAAFEVRLPVGESALRSPPEALNESVASTS
jgi:signal transduction histidine kinase